LPLAHAVDGLSIDSRQIMLAASACFQQAAYLHVRKVSCAFTEGLLTLRGQVTSYYEKQIAQEAVAKVDGVEQVLNLIQVAPRFDGIFDDLRACRVVVRQFRRPR
jgi:osmotically-inducible protein OsmY